MSEVFYSFRQSVIFPDVSQDKKSGNEAQDRKRPTLILDQEVSPS